MPGLNSVHCPAVLRSPGAEGPTPVKAATVTASDGHAFTPVKLGPESYMSDAALFSPTSAWALGGALDARVPQVLTGQAV